jgi:uncharacterized protein
MRVYADANVLVSLVARDMWTPRVYETLASETRQIVVSDYTVLEVASSLARLVRMKLVEPDVVRASFKDLDAWLDVTGARVAITGADISAATTLLRGLRHNVRGPDALHLAYAQRNHDAIWSFDFGLREVALALGLETAPALKT